MASRRAPETIARTTPSQPAWSAGPAMALLPLRIFLGVTFCFAGLQKLANPSFFSASSSSSIQAQLRGAAHHSPIGGMLTTLSPHATAIGILIAFGEIAFGVGILAGLLTRIAAAGGLLLSFSLFLAVSFHTNPYYTGSDIVFVFAWLPFVIAGGGPYSLDAYVRRVASNPRRVVGRPFEGPDVERRRLVTALAAGLGVATLIGTGVIAGIGRMLHTPSSATAAPTLGGAASSPGGSASPSSDGSSSPSPASPSPPSSSTTAPSGTKIGPASAVPVNGAAMFQDPASGDPAIVVQPKRGVFVAFDAVCPHAGCTVSYDRNVLYCPCHGSRFNADSGAVEIGPARTGLRKIAISEQPDGQLYAT